MSKLYGQAAYQGQRDDDDPMPKSRLKYREETQWRKDWSDEQYSIAEDTESEAYLRESNDQWNAMLRKNLPERLVHHFSIEEDRYVPTYGLTAPIAVEFSDEQRMFVATTSEYPELSFADDTAEDAIAGLREVSERYIMSLADSVESSLSDGWL
jgi:hypothetical protein